jgi:hypothetical protein
VYDDEVSEVLVAVVVALEQQQVFVRTATATVVVQAVEEALGVY